MRFAALIAVALLGCDRTPPPAPGELVDSVTSLSELGATRVRISGSSAQQPLVNAAKERFEAAHGGVSVEVSAGGSRKGLADVASGAVHIGASDLFAPPDLRGALVDHRVAVVGFAIMAHRGPYNDRVDALGVRELAAIFSGRVRDWRELGGDPQPIVVINRAPGSGTRTVVGQMLLGGEPFVEAKTEDNSGALVDKLRQSKGAISYLALSFTTPDVRVFPIRTERGAVEPTEANIVTGAYPLWAYEHMYTKGAPTGAVRLFLDYVLSPEFQERVLPSVRGFIPVTAMAVSKDED